MSILPSSWDEIAKQLPPSNAELQLLDVSLTLSSVDFMASRRSDVVVTSIGLQAISYRTEAETYDAIIALGSNLSTKQLQQLRHCLRPGGRIIVFDQQHSSPEDAANQLTTAGYGRILAERLPDGILYRGEQPYEGNLSTLERVSIVASQSSAYQLIAVADIDAMQGRYVQVLVSQTPNKPSWRLADGEIVIWHMATIESTTHGQLVLAFTALPKAVALMQQAVLKGLLPDIHKIVKFKKATAATWDMPLLLNPTVDIMLALASKTDFTEVDPTTAERPDE